MKNIKKITLIIFWSLFISISVTNSQTPPPPNNGNGAAGGSNKPVGGGAPLADGLIMLITASTLYILYTEKEHLISIFRNSQNQ